MLSVITAPIRKAEFSAQHDVRLRLREWQFESTCWTLQSWMPPLTGSLDRPHGILTAHCRNEGRVNPISTFRKVGFLMGIPESK